MKHGSLFSGIGGFDLAAEWMGWENVFHCEWNDFGKKILKYYWPNAISYDDITKTDFTIHRGKIDILTGGFPCQPFSVAGVRRGKEDERHLWPEMLRAIREIQPRWVVGENVYGLINWSKGLVFNEVQADLEVAGYEVQSFLLPAVSVGAPHRRDRIWFVAYSNGIRRNKNDRLCNGQNEKLTSEGRIDALGDIEQMGGDVADTGKNGLQQCKNTPKMARGQNKICEERNKPTLQFKTIGNIGNWETFPTQSPICHGDDGLSDRLDNITFSKWRQESIKGGGNAVVPQLVYTIFQTIEEYERQSTENI